MVSSVISTRFSSREERVLKKNGFTPGEGVDKKKGGEGEAKKQQAKQT